MAGRPQGDLQAEFTARVHAAIAAFGGEFEAAPILAEYQDRGVGRASVFRWMASARDTAGLPPSEKSKVTKAGKGGKKAAPAPPAKSEKPRRLDASRPQINASPAPPASPPVVVADIAARLPPVPKVEDVRTMGLLPVVELLRDCINHAQDLIKHARSKDDGSVRNSRLLMQASEHLRRSVETANRLNETVAIHQEMERFHRVCLEEIGREAPAVQERILTRIRRAADDALADG